MLSRILRLFSTDEPDCAELRAAASDFLDEDLHDRRRARLLSHIERCAPCRAFINTLRATIELLRASPTPVPSPDLRGRVRDRLGRV